MLGKPWDDLESAVKTFLAELSSEELTKKAYKISIVIFNSTAREV
jgi:hypothetical protein